MRAPSHITIASFLAAGLLFAACRSKGTAGSPGFVAVVTMPQNSLQGPIIPEKDMIAPLKARAQALGIPAEINPGEAGSDARISILLFADHLDEARAQLDLLCKITTLEVRRVHSKNRTLAPQVAAGDATVPGYELHTFEFKNDEGQPFSEPLLLAQQSVLEPRHLAQIRVDGSNPGVVQVLLTPTGGKSMKAFTDSMVEGVDRLAIVIDDEVRGAPLVRSALSEILIISGLEEAESRNIAGTLRYPLEHPLAIEALNALPAP